MAIDPKEIELTEAQRRELAELANRVGKPWAVVYRDALRHYPLPAVRACGDGEARTLYDALAEDRLVGCFDGPPDLSTNPKYMEGFGQSGSGAD
jgi:hypothetical protein